MDKFDTRTTLKDNSRYIAGKILDLGCGRAKYKSLVLQWGKEYIGADFYKHENVDIFTDARNTPFPDNTFDTIICMQVLEHVQEPHKVAAECFRVLKRGGHLILTTPWLYPFHGEPEDFFRFSSLALKFLFEQAGFKIVKIESRGGRLRVISGFMRKWIKNDFFKKMVTDVLNFFDSWFNKKNDNLDTPSHVLVAQK